MISNHNLDLIKAYCSYPKGTDHLNIEDKKRIDAMVKELDQFRVEHLQGQTNSVSHLLLLCLAFERGFEAGEKFQKSK